tara:strand:- start:276 stop:443 length:168 start_codon:yes stop_codon:yes gene_type:complete
MDRFDPALHYGPNDAGVSAVSIALVIVLLVLGSWAVGAVYQKASNLFQKLTKKED